MARLAFMTLTSPGHWLPMSCLALHMRDRGHEPVFFCLADAEAFYRGLGLKAVVIGREHAPLGATPAFIAKLATLKGLGAVRFTVSYLADLAEMQMRELPDALRAAGIECMVIDQFFFGGGAVADRLHLPRVHVANALLLNTEPGLPPINLGWGPGRTALSRLRNTMGMRLSKSLLSPVKACVNRQRKAWGLAPYSDFADGAFLGGAQICQQPPGFEYPRKRLPGDFHFVGPLHSRRLRPEPPFPWKRLDGRPLIYASMGTLQNGLAWVFHAILKACEGLDAQLVVSLGSQLSATEFDGYAGQPILVQSAPQLALLARAQLCITHAGLNTALESLAAGVPMVALPVTNDQPGVAARIQWIGAGLMLTLDRLTADRLRCAVQAVLATPSYRENAERMRDEIAGLDSLAAAAAVIEGSLGPPGGANH